MAGQATADARHKSRCHVVTTNRTECYVNIMSIPTKTIKTAFSGVAEPLTFALYFGNRGFFPEMLIEGARTTLTRVVERAGHKALLLDPAATRFGAVESAEEGEAFAAFLKQHEGRIDGVILSLPNFGDETGAVAALQSCNLPILIQAWPDEVGKMDFQHRRDAFCGKFSVMDVFYQYGVKYSAYPPHTVHPESPEFAEQLTTFAATCRVVKRMRRLTVGAIGARTTAFKTVRFDELTLQKYGITTETLDLSEVFQRIGKLDSDSEACRVKKAALLNYTNWEGVPADKIETMVKLGVALDDIISENRLDCLALRCWIELEKELGISPCTIVSELNDRGIPTACELDVCNAIPMMALALASQGPATCLDWNNNVVGDENKCILFHCGPVPQKLMTCKGQVIEHPMFAKSLGAGCGWGCNVGRIRASRMTFASSKTEDGKLRCYIGEGEFTTDEIESGFFGCAGVVRIDDLQEKLLSIGRQGYRHHVAIGFGNFETAIRDALENYLGYEFVSLSRK